MTPPVPARVRRAGQPDDRVCAGHAHGRGPLHRRRGGRRHDRVGRSAPRRTSSPVRAASAYLLVLPAMFALYNALFWALAGRTPGMAVLGLRVVGTRRRHGVLAVGAGPGGRAGVLPDRRGVGPGGSPSSSGARQAGPDRGGPRAVDRDGARNGPLTRPASRGTGNAGRRGNRPHRPAGSICGRWTAPAGAAGSSPARAAAAERRAGAAAPGRAAHRAGSCSAPASAW